MMEPYRSQGISQNARHSEDFHQIFCCACQTAGTAHEKRNRVFFLRRTADGYGKLKMLV